MAIGKYDQETQDVVQVLVACARECRHCAQACQDEEEAAALEACIRLSQDCADICALGADLLRRRSIFHARLRDLCAEVSEACADECARHPALAQCRDCEETCRHCAEVCRSQAGAMA